MSTKPVIFVQGANGNVGMATVKALCKHQDRFCIKAAVPDKDPDKFKPLTELGVEIVEFSTDKPETYEALKGANRVMIIPPNKNNRADIANKVADIAVENGAQYLVIISVRGVETQGFQFAKEFYGMEQHIKSLPVNYCFLRCELFMDNFLGQAKEVKNGTISSPIRNGKYPPVFLADIGESAANLLLEPSKENKAFEITGPDALSGTDIANIFSDVTHRPAKFISPDPQEVKKGFLSTGMEEWQANGSLELYELVATGKKSKVADDLSKLIRRKPTSFREFVQKNLPVFTSGEQAV